jgi:NADPH-dependent ferric siderophore reductase
VEVVGFDAETAAEVEALIDRLQGDHPDSLAFLASETSERVDRAASVSVRSVAPDGMVVEIGAPRPVTRRLGFDGSASTLAEVQGALYGLLFEARAAAPDHPETSVERLFASTSSLQTHIVEVTGKRSLGETFVELTLRADDDLPALGGDEFWYVLAPRPGAEHRIAPGFTMDDRALGPEAEQPWGAYYTTRRRRDVAREIDVWVARHDHPEGVGAWARTAAVGDCVAIWGPRVGYEPRADAAGHLLVCDETGLPACVSIIEQLPVDHPITLVAEVVGPTHRPPVPTRDRLDVVWVERGDGVPGAGRRLLAAVQRLALDVDGLVAFGAAESREITAVRRHLRDERGMPQATVHMTGYWRRDV